MQKNAPLRAYRSIQHIQLPRRIEDRYRSEGSAPGRGRSWPTGLDLQNLTINRTTSNMSNLSRAQSWSTNRPMSMFVYILFSTCLLLNQTIWESDHLEPSPISPFLWSCRLATKSRLTARRGRKQGRRWNWSPNLRRMPQDPQDGFHGEKDGLPLGVAYFQTNPYGTVMGIYIYTYIYIYVYIYTYIWYVYIYTYIYIYIYMIYIHIYDICWIILVGIKK